MHYLWPWYHLTQALWLFQLPAFFFRVVALLAWCAEFKTEKAEAAKVLCDGQKMAPKIPRPVSQALPMSPHFKNAFANVIKSRLLSWGSV